MIASVLRALLVLLVGLLAGLAPASAGPALLFEPASGEVLYAEDADQPWHPASLTKLMTAYLAFSAVKAGTLKLDEQLTCSEAAFSTTPSKVGLLVGQQISVDLAIRALIVKSANDMAVLLAERIGGSEAGFVQLMNATAARLGMSRTHFANASGLPNPAQVSTARDLGRLTTALIAEFSDQAPLFATPVITIGKRKLASHNSLLKTYAGADGMKTGFICDSGYNVVASATRDGRRLVAVVLGEPSAGSRSDRASALLDHGFAHFDWKVFLEPRKLSTMPSSVDASAVVASIRKEVHARACGYRPAKVAGKGKKGKGKAGKDKTATAAEGAAATGGTAETGTAEAGKSGTKKEAGKTGAKKEAAKKPKKAGTKPAPVKTEKKKKLTESDGSDATGATSPSTTETATAP